MGFFTICAPMQAGTAEALPAALPFEPDEVDCAWFLDERFGDLLEEQLRVARWGEGDQVATIRYRYRFLRQPNVPDTVDGSLPRNQSFQIDIMSGEPLRDPFHVFRHVPPQDHKHMKILVSAGFDRPIWIHLNWLDEHGQGETQHVELPNGDRVRKPTHFDVIGPYVGDFQQITWPFPLGEGGLREYHEKFEYAVAYSADGEISELLQCGRLDAYPNPSCAYSFRIDPLRAKVRFNRRLLDQIEFVRHRARTFVGCLLQ